MKILSSLKSTLKLATVASAVIATTSLTNCGGGSAADGLESATIRPKTLENVKLTMPGGAVSFEFIRNSASTGAGDNGMTEFGGIIYTKSDKSTDLTTIDNTVLTIHWAEGLEGTTYTYTAINDTSGEITITASNVNHTLEPFDPALRLHHLFDNAATTNGVSSARLIVSFEDNGGSAKDATIRMEDPDEPLAEDGAGPGSSTTVFGGTFTVNGTALPTNYNPNFDGPNRVSKIALASLHGKVIRFVDSTAAASNFTLLPIALASAVNDVDEIGQTTYLDSADQFVTDSADYTYDRTNGTDSGIMILTGTAPAAGTFVLNFLSPSTATQSASGVYSTSGGRQGTFTAQNP